MRTEFRILKFTKRIQKNSKELKIRHRIHGAPSEGFENIDSQAPHLKSVVWVIAGHRSIRPMIYEQQKSAADLESKSGSPNPLNGSALKKVSHQSLILDRLRRLELPALQSDA